MKGTFFQFEKDSLFQSDLSAFIECFWSMFYLILYFYSGRDPLQPFVSAIIDIFSQCFIHCFIARFIQCFFDLQDLIFNICSLRICFYSGWGLLQPDVSALPQADGWVEKSHGGSAQSTMSYRETTKGEFSLSKGIIPHGNMWWWLGSCITSKNEAWYIEEW